VRCAHRESSVCWAVLVRTAHPTVASPKLLLRFSLQSGAYEHESCACSRDPGEKCGLIPRGECHRVGPGLITVICYQPGRSVGGKVVEAAGTEFLPEECINFVNGAWLACLGVEDVIVTACRPGKQFHGVGAGTLF